MYQVTATYKVISKTHVKLNAFQKFFGMPDTTEDSAGGTVQFTAHSIGEVGSKLQYLVEDVNTVEDMSIRKI